MKFKSLFLVFCVVILCCNCSKDDDKTAPNNPPSGGPQFPCENGMAGIFPCEGYDLMAHIDLKTFGSNSGSDCWGWIDPSTGKEYAIVGLDDGTAFVDISQASNPIYLGKLPTVNFPSAWRDIKTYQHYAFIVSEAQNYGMQVFDLNRLRNVENPPVEFTVNAHFQGFGSAHNIAINEETGYAYVVGSSSYVGGPIFINIQNPLNPVQEGGYPGKAYTHDAQILIYNGPDTEHQGKEILFGSNETKLVILDVTDKSNPVFISEIGYQNIGYTHQSWLTEDQQFLLMGDEFDENNFGFNTRTIVFDIKDLDKPAVNFEYLGPTPAIDHNGYIKGNTFYLANYSAGLRMINLSEIETGNMEEIGFFDTYPEDNAPAFNGVWSVYPFFESENIVISDINRGLFIIKKK